MTQPQMDNLIQNCCSNQTGTKLSSSTVLYHSNLTLMPLKGKQDMLATPTEMSTWHFSWSILPVTFLCIIHKCSICHRHFIIWRLFLLRHTNVLIIIRPHYSTAYVDVAYCHWPSTVVCHTSEPCKNGWTNQDAVWVQDSAGPKEPCIRGGPHTTWEQAILRGKGHPIVKYRGWTDRDVIWVMDSGGPKEACLRWGPDGKYHKNVTDDCSQQTA